MFILRTLLLVLTIAIIVGNKGFSQSSDIDLRTVNIVSADSIIKTTACYPPKKQKPQADYNYYWYEAGKINHNNGGFSGKLLHGKYEVFDNQQKLRVKGAFEFGIITGNWTRWYGNGNTQVTSFYKKGVLQGEVKTYTSDGKLHSVLNYRNGILQGKSYFFQPDTTITKKYKSGIEVVKIEKSKKKCFLKKNKKKDSDPKVNSSESKEIKASEQEKDKQINDNSSKKKWWKFSFLKKKQKDSKKENAPPTP